MGKRELIFSYVGEERAWGRESFSYVCSVCACLDLSVSSSSWNLGRTAVCDCGTPWTFLLPFFFFFFFFFNFFTLCHFVLVFFSPFSIAITSLGEERANLSAFRTFDRFVLVWICPFPLPLDVWEGLRFVIVALPGLFSYLFFFNTRNRLLTAKLLNQDHRYHKLRF